MDHEADIASPPEKEEKMSGEEIKMMKALESGKMVEDKIVEEDMLIRDNESLKWYVKNYYDIHPTDGMVWKDYAMISKQRRIIFQLVKQVGTNLLKGKSIMTISLPIQIMEPMTVIQRSPQSYAYLPHFVGKLTTTDPIERLKHYLSFMISSLHLNLHQRKPLNPVLGETYQGYIGNEQFTICCEQTSHHPPISSMIIDTPTLTIYWSRYIEARTYPNSAFIRTTEKQKIVFKDAQNTTYKVKSFPDLRVGGILMGKRKLAYEGFLTLKDVTNKLYAQIRFDPEKQGFFEKIFKKTQPHRPDFFKGLITKNKAVLKDVTRKAFYSKEILAYIEGNWLETIKIDGDTYWEIGREEPFPLVNAANSLDSDSTKRSDSIALSQGKEDEAQKCKEVIEDIQRKDRKLREIASKQAGK